ncbi:MAG: hypothetical protein GY930_12620 [bacterium]|nr:hypothetical protein [bacterium]
MKAPPILTFLTCWLVLGPAQAMQAEVKPAPAPKVSFSEPSLGKVWASVGPDTEPAPLPVKAPALDSAPFGSEVLQAWSAALSQVQASQAPLQARLEAHLSLCLIAKAQGRDQDAWFHLQKLGDGPQQVARALPYLWPGVPFDTPIGKGSRLTLPAGALLKPAFPLLPSDRHQGEEGPPRMTWTGGLTVQGKAMDLRFTLQPEGIELDLWNRASKPLSIKVILPSPRNFECSYTYSDWEKTLDAHLGIAIELPAGRENSWTLFSRLKPAFEAWPASPKAGAGWFKDRSMRLLLARDEPPTPALKTLAKVLRDLLGIPVDFGTQAQELPPRCVMVDLGPDSTTAEGKESSPLPARQARMRRLLSSVELFLLP